MGFEIMAGAERFAPAIGSWLLTFLVHSTLLMGVAWVIATRMAERPDWREVIWRVALLGSIATASLAQFDRDAVFGGATPSASSAALLVESAEVSERSFTPAEVRTSLEPETSRARENHPASNPAGPAVGRPLLRLEAEGGLWIALVGVWLLGAFGGLIRFGRAHRRLAKLLRGRVPLSDPESGAALESLQRRLGYLRSVDLICVKGMPAPAAVTQQLVAVPPDYWSSLTPAQKESVLAHELAHLQRHDLRWLFVIEMVGALFFFQPLVAVARRQLRECAELLCDDVAVACTGRRRDLVESLLELANRMRGDAATIPVPSLAAPASPFVRRASRIIHGQPRRRPPLAMRVVLTTVLVAGFTPLAPVARAAIASQVSDGSLADGLLLASENVSAATRLSHESDSTDLRSVGEPDEAAAHHAAVEDAFAHDTSLVHEPMVAPAPTSGQTGTVEPVRTDTSRVGRPLTEALWNTFLVHTYTDDEGEAKRVVRFGAMGVNEWRRYDPHRDAATPVHLALEEQEDGVLRRLELMPDGSGGSRAWYTVQGRPAPFDDEARSWLAERLRSLRG